jgi:hypothetical protein
MTQYAAIVALEGEANKDIEMMRVEFEKRKDYAVKAINNISKLSCYDPDGAFYLFINIKKYSNDSMKFCAEYVGMKKELLLQWMAESQMLEKVNVRLNDAAIQVSKWFLKKGFRTCILKGQGNALMYPNPYSRTPGDISDASREQSSGIEQVSLAINQMDEVTQQNAALVEEAAAAAESLEEQAGHLARAVSVFVLGQSEAGRAQPTRQREAQHLTRPALPHKEPVRLKPQPARSRVPSSPADDEDEWAEF